MARHLFDTKEALCAKYLDTVLPLLDTEEEKARTQAVVAAFMDPAKGDGPKLQALLEEYDNEQDNYVEHFVRLLLENRTSSPRIY